LFMNIGTPMLWAINLFILSLLHRRIQNKI